MSVSINSLPVSNKMSSSNLKTTSNSINGAIQHGSIGSINTKYGSGASYGSMQEYEYIDYSYGTANAYGSSSSEVVRNLSGTGSEIGYGTIGYGSVGTGSSLGTFSENGVIKRYNSASYQTEESILSEEELMKQKEKQRKMREAQQKKLEEQKKQQAMVQKTLEDKKRAVSIVNDIDSFNLTVEDIANYGTNGGSVILSLKNGIVITLVDGKVSTLYNSSQNVTYYYRDGIIVGSDNPDAANIFNVNNSYYGQFGGSQLDFANNVNTLAQDPILVNKIRNVFGQNITYEQIVNYLYSIKGYGCHFTALINGVFRKYIGREKEFYDTFGYPMYTVDENGNMDYNYEYMITEIHAYYWSHNFDYDQDGTIDQYGYGDINSVAWYSNGLNDQGCAACYDYLRETYHFNGSHGYTESLTPNDFSRYTSEGKTVIVNVSGYSLYTMDGYYYSYGTAGHAMTVVGTTTDPYGNQALIVSNWGQEYICTIDRSNGFEYYDIIE